MCKRSARKAKYIRDAVGYLEGQADQIKAAPALQETRGRMLYEAVWVHDCSRSRRSNQRLAIVQENQKKLNLLSSKFPLEVPIEKVPLLREKRAACTR